MSEPQYQNWLLFFRALHISHQPFNSASVETVKRKPTVDSCDFVLQLIGYLSKFYRGLQALYGLDICDPILHCVGAHAWEDLFNLGPLSDRSAAPFEVQSLPILRVDCFWTGIEQDGNGHPPSSRPQSCPRRGLRRSSHLP
jgi:hypothetical protein